MVVAVSIVLSLACTSNALASTKIGSFTATPSSTQAGGHPDLNLAFSLDAASNAEIAKDVTYDAPPGVGLLPAAVTHCLAVDLALNECPPTSQVGLITVRSRYEGEAEFLLGTAPVYALDPPSGQYGALGFTLPTIDANETDAVSLRGESDYGTRLSLTDLPEDAPISTVDLTLWGIPAEVGHDAERFPRGSPGNPPGCPGLEDAGCIPGPTESSLPPHPFTLNPTTCGSQPSTTLEVKTYESPQTSSQSETSYPEATGCDQLSFNQSFFVEPTSTVAYSRSGLRLNVGIPQQMSPTIPGPSGLRELFLTLPKGLDISPELPEGLVACDDAEAALGSEEPAACPEEALLGTASVELPSLTGPLSGKIFLGITESEEEERLLLIAEGQGVDLKLPIDLSEEPESGQLQLALEQPQIPISFYALDLFGGRNSIFRTPAFCGAYPTTAEFTPWDEALGTQVGTQFFQISSGPGGGPCLGDATAIRVKLSPEAIPADGKSQTAVTIEVQDAEGAGLPEQEVELTSSDPAERLGEVVDNEDGTYSATITASGTSGVATITATDLSAKHKLSGSASLRQGAGSVQPPPPPPPPTMPRVSFSVKPPTKDRNRRPRFAFEASAAGASFSCRLDRGAFRPCTSPLQLPRLTPGPHVLSVRASTAAGTGAAAVWHFTVLGSGRHRHSHHHR